MSSTTAASTITTSTYAYDTVDGGQVPQLLSDTANSYVYGPGMGGTAPVEQISGSSAVSFCFSAPSGVQAVVTKATSSTASLSELANYSIHGTRTLSAAGPTLASPFGFQGAYTDASTGFLYLFNRYYDPRSAQFLSVDPALLSTAQPYALDGGNSLNVMDPLGLYQGCISREACGSGSGWRENGGTIACSSNCGGGYPTSTGNSYDDRLQGYIDAWDRTIGQGWISGAQYGAARSRAIAQIRNQGVTYDHAAYDSPIQSRNLEGGPKVWGPSSETCRSDALATVAKGGITGSVIAGGGGTNDLLEAAGITSFEAPYLSLALLAVGAVVILASSAAGIGMVISC
jgi:RHS repeat-associated protein